MKGRRKETWIAEIISLAYTILWHLNKTKRNEMKRITIALNSLDGQFECCGWLPNKIFK